MTTNIQKKFEVNEPIDKVWKYLTDPEKIVVCVPGASLKEIIDENNFKGGVTLKLGPVKAKYNGDISFQDMDPDNHKMTLKGKGLDAKGKGSADMLMKTELSETANGTTVDCNMQISIVGKLAQFGARLINDVSDQIFNQFVDNFKTKLAEESAPDMVEQVSDQIETATESAGEKIAATARDVAADAQETVQKTAATVSQKATEAAAATRQKVKEAAQRAETPASSNNDNSLNAFSLMWAVIKGWFSRLFGGGK